MSTASPSRRLTLPNLTDLMLAPVPDSGSERLTRAMHHMRLVAFRIRADCERMMEDRHGGSGAHDNGVARQSLADAYVASRELAALTSHALLGDAETAEAELRLLITRLQGPQRR